MHGSFRRYIVTIRMQHATLPPSADHHTMNFQKTNTTLSVLVAILICSSGSRLHAAESSATTNAASTNASTNNNGFITLAPIRVLAESPVQTNWVENYEHTFSPLEAKTATRTESPIIQTPFSEQVISPDVMKSQQNVRLNEAVQNVSGVIQQNTLGNIGDYFTIRGFGNAGLTCEDGLRNEGYNGGFARSMANVEAVEVVKGPSSVLYGQGEPGGLVNVVTKKPLESNYFNIEEQLGSYNFYRTTADASGPVTSDKKLLYRFNFEQWNARSFRDFIVNNHTSLFPTFQWRPTKNDQVTVELEYTVGNQVSDQGIPFLTNGTPANVSIRNNYSQPNANIWNNYQGVVKINASHSFSDDWKLHAGYRIKRVYQPGETDNYYDGMVDSSGTLNRSQLYQSVLSSWTQEILVDLTGKFKTWFVKHEALAGLDIYNNIAQYGANYSASMPSINIYQPNYNQDIPPFDPAGQANYFNNQTAFGVFVQDQMDLPWNFHGLVGARWDQASQGSSDTTGGSSSSLERPPVTPRFGLLWQPVKEASIYGNYIANYGLTSLGYLTQNGAALPPQTAQQWEFGVKGEFLNKKLTTTASIYQITKENIPTQDPTDPAFYVAVGQAQSKGFEYQLAGEILKGWRLIGGYSYINCFTTQDNSGLQGQRFPGVPYNSASLWSTYEIQSGPLKRLSFGAGVITRSESQAYGTDANGALVVQKIPGYGVVNAMASYPCQIGRIKWTAQVNVSNLFNTVYYSGVTTDSAQPGAPVSFLASLKAEF
jgi:iron complex outermembrane receptor protein